MRHPKPVSVIYSLAAMYQLAVSSWLIATAELQRDLASAGESTARITVLDARSGSAYHRGHVPGAIRIEWKDFRDGWGRTGKLSPDFEKVARRLEALGVDGRHPVVVYGAAREGWGEEGRIAWMLAYLGHARVRVLDGGYRAWIAAGGSASRDRSATPPGEFTVRVNPTVRANLADVAAAVGVAHGTAVSATHASAPASIPRTVVLDVRPRDEWDGARRYWEPRTGHIPGAVRFEWRELLDAEGRLRPHSELLPLLAQRGITPDRPIIVYCTGGVRSAEAFWMLRVLGFDRVRNYDGSWYEWAFDKSKPAVVGGPDGR